MTFLAALSARTSGGSTILARTRVWHRRRRPPAIRLCGLLLAVLFGPATASAQEIVNQKIVDGTRSSWLNSFTTTGQDGDRPSAKVIRLSLLVHHPPGRTVTGLRIDSDWDDADQSSVAPMVTDGLDVQQPELTGGFNYSRVNLVYVPPTDVFTDAVNAQGQLIYDPGVRVRALRIRAVLDDGTQTASSTSMVTFVQGHVPVPYGADFQPFLTGWFWARRASAARDTPSFFGPASPGDEMTFAIRGVDPDSKACTFPLPGFSLCGDKQEFVGLNWRIRNQLTGAVPATGHWCSYRDHEDVSAMRADGFAFASRGTFSVEGRLVDDNGHVTIDDDRQCNDWDYGHYFPVGSVDVNSATIPAPALSVPTQRPRVGAAISVSAAMPTDPDAGAGGKVQFVQWDVDGDPTTGIDGFEKTTLGTYDAGFDPGTVLSASIDTSTLTPGPKTARVRVTDNGAMSGADAVRASATAEVQYTVDTPPVLSTSGAETLSVGEATTIASTGTDADGDPLSWSVTAGPGHGLGSLRSNEGASTQFDYEPAPRYSGTDSVTLRAADPFGGVDTETIPITVVPATGLDSTPPHVLSSGIADFAFGSDSETVQFDCRLSGSQILPSDFAACGGRSQRYDGLRDGAYTFEVRARSIIGSVVDPSPASWQFVVDHVAPTVTIEAKPAQLGPGPRATFGFSSSEAGSFACRLDGDSPGGTGWVACGTGTSSIQTYPKLAEGQHTFAVRQIDAAENQSDATTYDWVIDSTAPVVRITRRPPRKITKQAKRTKVRIRFSSEARAGLECATDRAAFKRCSSPFTYSVTPGRHRFRVRATDQAGNLGPVRSVTFRFKRKR